MDCKNILINFTFWVLKNLDIRKNLYIIIFLLVVLQLNAQKRAERKNVVKLKAGHVLCADDRIVSAQNDTIVYLPTYVDFYIRKSSSDDFYQKIKDKAFSHRWSKELHNIILTTPSERKFTGDTISMVKSEVEFLPYKGLIVKNIYFNKLSVFGTSVYDTEGKPTSVLGRTGNKIHFKTQTWTLKNHLLFQSGDSISPFVLADNERIFRQLPFIEDARIIVKNINSTSDSADVEIITKDKWPVGIDFSSADLSNISVNIWNDNILGTGHEFENNYYRRPGRMPASGITGFYTINNLSGTFINSRIGYNAFGNQDYSIRFWRDFFTQTTKYAGSLFYENINRQYINTYDSKNNYYYDTIKGNNFNFWIGRALPIGKFSITSTSISNIAISAGVFSNHFTKRPIVNKNFHYEFQNKTYYLFSLAFSAQGHYKTNLVFNYGRTEDIPYGLLLKFTHGFEVNEYFQRMYNAVSFSKGNYIGNLGYFYGKIDLSGFLNQRRFEQGTMSISSQMFTNLMALNHFKFRNFISASFTKGYDRNDDERLFLSDLNGVRGFRSDSINGVQKFSLNIESVCFTPYYLAGFRFAVFTFADFGYIGPSSHSVFKNALYSGFGAGIRFRNERLVFKTFQVRLAFYPWLPKHAQSDFITVTSEARFMPNGFNISSPQINQFR